ncbi:TRAP transporter small permease [Algibacillus agarilyticus]|uniref:TRAP transporter small permease n=1 Tax=Algibacillus agarilyticus TaxID=2234133 RepID=UPI000DD0A3F3|nr:TRAP transporter small permease [Algibacillus agarilyticus]
MNTFKKISSSLIANGLVLLMVLIVFTVLWQVFSRYVLQAPSSTSEEVSRFLLIWLGLLGATYCYQNDSHLSLDILDQKLTGKPKAKLKLFVHTIILIFAVIVLVIGGASLVYTTLVPVQTSAVLGVKMAYVYSIVPIAGVIFTFNAVDKLWLAFQQHTHDNDNNHVGDNHGI